MSKVKLVTKVRVYVRGYRTYRRRRQGLAVWEPALEIAQTVSSDSAAVEQLAAVVTRHPKAAERALESAGDVLTPDGDRAYRLLCAVVHGGPVVSVDPGKAQQIAEMERWRHLPLRDAFDQLTARVPELVPVGAEAEAWAAAHPRADAGKRLRAFIRLTRRIDELLEYPRESSPELVIRSGLARSIAVEYVSVTLGDRERGDAATTYAQMSRTPHTLTISFGRRPVSMDESEQKPVSGS